MTSQRRILLATLLVVGVGMVLACGGKSVKPDKPLRLPGPDDKLIPYEVLNQKRFSGDKKLMGDGTTLDVLVSEKATKEEVMKLAEWIGENNKEQRMYFTVFDSREVWEYLDLGETEEQRAAWDRKFDTKEKRSRMEEACKRHTLAGSGPDLGSKVAWTAQGRGH